MIAELYEEWLSSGQNWINSSIVANSSRTSKQKKRGTHIMVDFKSLKAKYGPALAKQLRDEKKKLQEEKQEADETVYYMKHPDFGDTTEA